MQTKADDSSASQQAGTPALPALRLIFAGSKCLCTIAATLGGDERI